MKRETDKNDGDDLLHIETFHGQEIRITLPKQRRGEQDKDYRFRCHQVINATLGKAQAAIFAREHQPRGNAAQGNADVINWITGGRSVQRGYERATLLSFVHRNNNGNNGHR